MTANGPTCGEFGGRNASGRPCRHPAGRGTEAPVGPCSDHAPEPPHGITPAPAGLTVESQRTWYRILDIWPVGHDRRLLLRGALEAWDRYRSASEVVAREGLYVTNPESGVKRQHPAAAVVRDSFREFRLALKQVGLAPQAAQFFEDKN